MCSPAVAKARERESESCVGQDGGAALSAVLLTMRHVEHARMALAALVAGTATISLLVGELRMTYCC